MIASNQKEIDKSYPNLFWVARYCSSRFRWDILVLSLILYTAKVTVTWYDQVIIEMFVQVNIFIW